MCCLAMMKVINTTAAAIETVSGPSRPNVPAISHAMMKITPSPKLKRCHVTSHAQDKHCGWCSTRVSGMQHNHLVTPLMKHAAQATEMGNQGGTFGSESMGEDGVVELGIVRKCVGEGGRE